MKDIINIVSQIKLRYFVNPLLEYDITLHDKFLDRQK